MALWHLAYMAYMPHNFWIFSNKVCKCWGKSEIKNHNKYFQTGGTVFNTTISYWYPFCIIVLAISATFCCIQQFPPLNLSQYCENMLIQLLQSSLLRWENHYGICHCGINAATCTLQHHTTNWFQINWTSPSLVGICWSLSHLGRDKMAVIFQTTFSNSFSWMKLHKFPLRFHLSLLQGVQLSIFQHWFSHYLNQWWLLYWRIYASLGLNDLTLIRYWRLKPAVNHIIQHIEAETKWPPFSRRHFQIDFLEWKHMNFD